MLELKQRAHPPQLVEAEAKIPLMGLPGITWFSLLSSRIHQGLYRRVSILVLMDSSLQFASMPPRPKAYLGFNPCFNGFFSSIRLLIHMALLFGCFNPCFNGFFSSICMIPPCLWLFASFNPCFNGFFSSIYNRIRSPVI